MSSRPFRRLPLRPGLLWSLAASVAASAGALWWPASAPPSVVQAEDRAPSPAAPRALNAVADMALPEQLPLVALEPGDEFDPFAGVQAPPPAPAPPPPVPPAPPPPEPVAPPVNVRFLGRMSDPEGSSRVYLSQGDQALPASVGLSLDNGYVVQSIDENEVHLHYAPLNATVVVPIPPAPETAGR